MNNNRNETIFTVLGVLSIIIGILYSITIIGLIAGIPLIIAATKFFKWSKETDDEVLEQKESITIWCIVVAIIMFPLGLLAIIPLLNLNGQLTGAVNNTVSKIKKDPMEEKIEKIKKLHQLKEDGVITEEDFKLAKDKILSE